METLTGKKRYSGRPPKLRLRPTHTVRRGGWVFWIVFALLLIGVLARLFKGVRL